MTGHGELAARRFVVTGRVQGVFFRASTVRVADRLGLRGCARNLPDGRVEVLALGTPAALADLAQWLREGPPLASVSDVAEDAADASALASLRDFRSA